jgi:hypothetical protein
MSLTSEFVSDTAAFLKTHVVQVPEAVDNVITRPSIRAFGLEEVLGNVVRLVVRPVWEEKFLAYYLPWKHDNATSTELSNTVNYFFTSHMTNCRFSVLDNKDPNKPRVAHVAGNNGNSAARDRMEGAAGFVDASNRHLARRFSISQSEAKKERPKYGGGKFPAVAKQHDYTGTSGAIELRSSAFVYGLRTDSEGWKFFAQIVKGDLSSPIVGPMDILNDCYHLQP